MGTHKEPRRIALALPAYARMDDLGRFELSTRLGIALCYVQIEIKWRNLATCLDRFLTLGLSC